MTVIDFFIGNNYFSSNTDMYTRTNCKDIFSQEDHLQIYYLDKEMFYAHL